MERTGLQRPWVRILLTVLTLAVMGMIFLFSTESAEKSDETSGTFTRSLIGVFYPDFDEYDAGRKLQVYDSIQVVVRKIAHFTEFAALGFLMRLCLESWFGKRKWLNPVSWAAGTLYAGTDELHQILSDGRSAQWEDILLDSAGVLAGVAVAALAVFLFMRRNKRKAGEKACP